MKRHFNPPQQTFIMRTMGSAFDPERFCEYTGRGLYQFPANVERRLMGYFRTDGFLCAVRSMSPEEVAWIVDNPEPYAKEAAEFNAWLDKTRHGRKN